MPNFNRIKWKFFSFSRSIHIYVSTSLFTILVFFSVTGITLNHTALIGSSTEAEQQFSLPANVVSELAVPAGKHQTWLPQLASLHGYLSDTHSLQAPRSIDMDRDYQEISLDYPLPAGYAFIIVKLQQSNYVIEYKEGDIWNLMNDLHKGRNTGESWSWVIDISAALILIFSITGLTILFQIKRKRRNLGLIACVAGTLTPIMLYWLWVPQLTGL